MYCALLTRCPAFALASLQIGITIHPHMGIARTLQLHREERRCLCKRVHSIVRILYLQLQVWEYIRRAPDEVLNGLIRAAHRSLLGNHVQACMDIIRCLQPLALSLDSASGKPSFSACSHVDFYQSLCKRLCTVMQAASSSMSAYRTRQVHQRIKQTGFGS